MAKAETNRDEVLCSVSFMMGREVTRFGDLTPVEVEIVCRAWVRSWARHNEGDFDA